jgi:hypothetical protein
VECITACRVILSIKFTTSVVVKNAITIVDVIVSFFLDAAAVADARALSIRQRRHTRCIAPPN